MREIKFRGKDEDTGEWIYGGIVHQTDFYGDTCDKWFIITGNETNDYDIGYPYLVEEKSIGQFTGLKDKNGKEIYEGDIFVDDEFQLTYICVFEEGCFRLKCYGFVERYVSDNATNEFWEEIECDPISFYEIKNMEVIGNIYENPDLLGE